MTHEQKLKLLGTIAKKDKIIKFFEESFKDIYNYGYQDGDAQRILARAKDLEVKGS